MKGPAKEVSASILTKKDVQNLDYVTKNFKKSELACPCCGKFNMSEPFLQFIQQVRTIAGVPMPVNSGVRCREHNIEVGGKPNSPHLDGVAVDIHIVSDTNRFYIGEAAFKAGAMGVGIYKNFIHIDRKLRKNGPVMWYG
jgi:uncharacterized protein YcbK (DUF882 family)